MVRYQLRHAGASPDVLDNFREYAKVMAVGRWSTDKTLCRYTKPGQIQKVLAKISLLKKPLTLRCHQNMDKIIRGDLAALRELRHLTPPTPELRLLREDMKQCLVNNSKR